MQIKTANDFLSGGDKYPTTFIELLKRLNGYKNIYINRRSQASTNPGLGNRNGLRSQSNQQTQGSSFLQASGQEINFLAGTNGQFHPHITCHKCNVKGHYASSCPCYMDENRTPFQSNS